MSVSQILHMYITSLINMTFNTIIMKSQNMLKINNVKACKLNEELEIIIKTKRTHLYTSKSWWSSHQTPLESDASKIVTV